MSVGSFLGRLGRSLQSSVDDMRYQRDWGPNYKERFAAEQDYLNRMADEKAAKEERERRRQDEADRRAAAVEARAARDDEEQRFEGQAKTLAGLGAPQEGGSFLFPDPVQMGLARDPSEGEKLLERARRAAAAGRATKETEASEKDRDRRQRFEDDVEMARIRAGLAQSAADAAAGRSERLKTPASRYAQLIEQARKNVAAAISSEGMDRKARTPDQIGSLVRSEQDRLAGEDPAMAEFLAERAATASRAKGLQDRLGSALRFVGVPDAPGTVAPPPVRSGADPMVKSGGKLVPLSSLPPDKQAKARAALGL